MPSFTFVSSLDSDLPDFGRYQVVERLGAGGMGEVFLAIDRRLDRQVAVKRLRSNVLGEDSLRRLAREAQMVAQLNHPCVVQLYDSLNHAGDELLVMEYVPGTDLRTMLRDGSLSPVRLAAIGRDVAYGLAAAHERGILHRDLKVENILVTPTGRAKIADFGVAKSLEADEALTATGATPGTLRALSPEQVRGEALDERSDLFSLGVLLYEAATCRTPFSGSTPYVVLESIVRRPHYSVRELAPELPESLSRLIDSLLEKDPADRPLSARDVASDLEMLAGPPTESGSWAAEMTTASAARPIAAMRRDLESDARRTTWRRLGFGLSALAAVIAIAFFVLRSLAPDPIYLAVFDLETAGATDLEVPIDAAVRFGMLRALTSLEAVSVLEGEELGDEPGLDAGEAARAAAADELLVGRLDCESEVCRASLRRRRVADGALIATAAFDIPIDDPALVSRAALEQTRGLFSERRSRASDSRFEVDTADYAEFLQLRRSFLLGDGLRYEEILERLEVLRTRAPKFLAVDLLLAEVARARFHETRQPDYLERAQRASRRALDKEPREPQALETGFYIALGAGQLEEADALLDRLAALTPGDAEVLAQRAHLLEARGQLEEAVATLEKAVERHPSWRMWLRLAQIQYRTGDFASAKASLESSLKRSPENLGALSLLAQLSLVDGDARAAADLYRRLSERSGDLQERVNLGVALTLLGDYEEAVQILRAVADQRPDNPIYLYNLADALLLAGRSADAEALYEQVVEAVARDPAAGWQLRSAHAQALAHLGRSREAVAAIQELLPKHRQLAYEASVVYTLAGDIASASVHAERALEQGVHRQWFGFPWFEPLRAAAPELQES
ncbi:MAG: protein kinase [Acidobacteriota bacterium]